MKIPESGFAPSTWVAIQKPPRIHKERNLGTLLHDHFRAGTRPGKQLPVIASLNTAVLVLRNQLNIKERGVKKLEGFAGLKLALGPKAADHFAIENDCRACISKAGLHDETLWAARLKGKFVCSHFLNFGTTFGGP